MFASGVSRRSLLLTPDERGGGGKMSGEGRECAQVFGWMQRSPEEGTELSHETAEPLKGSDRWRQAKTQYIPSMRCSFTYTWAKHVLRLHRSDRRC